MTQLKKFDKSKLAATLPPKKNVIKKPPKEEAEEEKVVNEIHPPKEEKPVDPVPPPPPVEKPVEKKPEKDDLVRTTIDLPAALYKKIKMRVVELETTMRDYFIDIAKKEMGIKD